MPRTHTMAAATGRRLPNGFDVAALVCVIAALVALSGAARGTFVPLETLHADQISLDPAKLPEYALRTTLRMFAALFASLLFTLTYAPLAANSRRAGMILVPILDILQPGPILGFLSFPVTFLRGRSPSR